MEGMIRTLARLVILFTFQVGEIVALIYGGAAFQRGDMPTAQCCALACIYCAISAFYQSEKIDKL